MGEGSLNPRNWAVLFKISYLRIYLRIIYKMDPMCMCITTCISHCQSAFVGAIAIGDLIKSTLGPKGMVCMCTPKENCPTLPFPPPSASRTR